MIRLFESAELNCIKWIRWNI